MATKLDETNWKKSSFSGVWAPIACVETRLRRGEVVEVRDSKGGFEGPSLYFSQKEWTAFIAGVKNGEFDYF